MSETQTPTFLFIQRTDQHRTDNVESHVKLYLQLRHWLLLTLLENWLELLEVGVPHETVHALEGEELLELLHEQLLIVDYDRLYFSMHRLAQHWFGHLRFLLHLLAYHQLNEPACLASLVAKYLHGCFGCLGRVCW